MDAPPPRNSPLRKKHDLSEASAKQLRLQLRYELSRVKEETGLGPEKLALKLGYSSGASVSKWLNGHAVVSEKCAKELDRQGYRTDIGWSFAQLQQAYATATKHAGGAKAGSADRHYDLFLASPMASLSGKPAYEKERKAARDLKESIENFLGYSVYYAGETLESKVEFDSPLVAAEQNFDALHNARFFVLLSVSKATKPSSVTVEAGYALARRIPSLYLVRNVEHLPFVLRSLGSHKSPDLPAVDVEVVESAERAVGLMRHQGKKILKRLEEQTRPRKSESRPRSRKRARRSKG
ncbi:MAG: hypothetical protein ACTHK3_09255 [Solirubrobacterales bacterium]